MRTRLGYFFQGRIGLFFKCGSLLFLLLVSVLVAACGANNTAQVPGAPPVTVTINLNRIFASPTPPLPPYSCGAWTTEATPGYYQGAVVDVYAKYVQNVNGNPQGMNQATAIASVYWPDGSVVTLPAVHTTSDGLAVFQIPLQPSAVNHVVLVGVSFTSADGSRTCNVSESQRAFFTAQLATPSATAASASPTTNPFPTPSGIPTFPVPGPRKSPTP